MNTIWTPAKRVITALTLGQPDEIPTFELEFQLSYEFFGYDLDDARLHGANKGKYSKAELESFADLLRPMIPSVSLRGVD